MNIDDFKPVDVQWCETCASHVSGECDGCHVLFEDGETQYRSQSHHFHPKSIEGVGGTVAIHKKLCVDCYRKDFERVYQQPAPPLPDRGMDPKFFAGQQRAKVRKRVAEVVSAAVDRPLEADEARYLRELAERAIR